MSILLSVSDLRALAEKFFEFEFDKVSKPFDFLYRASQKNKLVISGLLGRELRESDFCLFENRRKKKRLET